MNTQEKQISVIIVTLLLFLILLTFTVYRLGNKIENLKFDQEVLYLQLSKKKDEVRELEVLRIKERDSLYIVIKERDKINSLLITENKNLEKKIKAVRDREIHIPQDIPGMVEYFNKRYLTNKNEVKETYVGLEKHTSQSVILDLENKDKTEEILFLREEQIFNKDSIIVNLDSTRRELESIILFAEKEIDERKSLQSIADENIKNLMKQNKKLNTKNKLNKYLLPIGVFAGGFIGYQIAK